MTPSITSPSNKGSQTNRKKSIQFSPFSPMAQKQTTNSKSTPTKRALECGEPEMAVEGVADVHQDENMRKKQKGVAVEENWQEKAFNIQMAMLNKKIDYIAKMYSKTESNEAREKDGPSNVVRSKSCFGQSSRWASNGSHSFSYDGEDPGEMNIVLKSNSEKDRGFGYIIHPDSLLSIVIDDFALKMDTKSEMLRMTLNRKVVKTFETAEAVGLKDGDTIIVESIDPRFNVDTRYKGIVIEQTTHENPLTLRLKAPIVQKLEDLHRTWAVFTDEDLNNFDLVHKMTTIPRYGTVADEGIKNGAKLFCMRAHDYCYS